MAGRISAPASASSSMLRRWIRLNGVSRGTITRRRRSLSATSAARSMRFEETPPAIRPTVPIEHGTMAMPSNS